MARGPVMSDCRLWRISRLASCQYRCSFPPASVTLKISKMFDLAWASKRWTAFTPKQSMRRDITSKQWIMIYRQRLLQLLFMAVCFYFYNRVSSNWHSLNKKKTFQKLKNSLNKTVLPASDERRQTTDKVEITRNDKTKQDLVTLAKTTVVASTSSPITEDDSLSFEKEDPLNDPVVKERLWFYYCRKCFSKIKIQVKASSGRAPRSLWHIFFANCGSFSRAPPFTRNWLLLHDSVGPSAQLASETMVPCFGVPTNDRLRTSPNRLSWVDSHVPPVGSFAGRAERNSGRTRSDRFRGEASSRTRRRTSCFNCCNTIPRRQTPFCSTSCRLEGAFLNCHWWGRENVQ